MLPTKPRSRLLRIALFVLALATSVVIPSIEAESRHIRIPPGKNTSGLQEDFYIQSLNISSERQGGTILDLFVALSYDPSIQAGTGTIQYPDYRLLLKMLSPLRQPSEEYPEQLQWEVLVQKMVKLVLAEPGIDGAAVQLRVHPRCDVVDGEITARNLWRAAMASDGDAPTLGFMPSLDSSACQRR